MVQLPFLHLIVLLLLMGVLLGLMEADLDRTGDRDSFEGLLVVCALRPLLLEIEHNPDIAQFLLQDVLGQVAWLGGTVGDEPELRH